MSVQWAGQTAGLMGPDGDLLDDTDAAAFTHRCGYQVLDLNRGDVLAVEGRLAPIAQLASGANCRIGGLQLHDQPVRSIAGVVGYEQP